MFLLSKLHKVTLIYILGRNNDLAKSFEEPTSNKCPEEAKILA